MDVYPGTNTFRRIFVCPSAMRNSFIYLRPHIGLDACHMKNRRYPMQVFLATAMDGNNHIAFLAWALIDREDEDNWSWFCNMLAVVIYGIERPHVSFVSDRQKGLVHAVRNIFPGHPHVHCTVHLERNVKTRYGLVIEKVFKKLHRAKSESRFKQILSGIESLNKKAYAYIIAIDPQCYAQFAVKCSRYGQTSTNVTESANAAILEFRNYAPLKLLTELYKYLMEIVAKRHKEALDGVGRLTEFADDCLRKNEARAGEFRVYQASPSDCLVSSASSGEEFVVTSHPQVDCQCLELRDMKWPCPHVMAWDRELRRNSERLVHLVWTREYLQLAYSRTLVPFQTNELVPLFCCGPPAQAVRMGRHRIRRIPSCGSQNRSREHSGVITFPACARRRADDTRATQPSADTVQMADIERTLAPKETNVERTLAPGEINVERTLAPGEVDIERTLAAGEVSEGDALSSDEETREELRWHLQNPVLTTQASTLSEWNFWD